VVHLAKSGRLIVKLNSTGAGLRTGDLLVDASGKRIGRVAELIGPVRSPYASVIPMTDRAGRLAGSKVFVGGHSKPQGTHRGNKARREGRRA
jgi:rRNA processing protein Gar1